MAINHTFSEWLFFHEAGYHFAYRIRNVWCVENLQEGFPLVDVVKRKHFSQSVHVNSCEHEGHVLTSYPISKWNPFGLSCAGADLTCMLQFYYFWMVGTDQFLDSISLFPVISHESRLSYLNPDMHYKFEIKGLKLEEKKTK